MDQGLGTAFSIARILPPRGWPRSTLATIALVSGLLFLSANVAAQELLAQSTSGYTGPILSKSQCARVIRNNTRAGARSCWELQETCRPGNPTRFAEREDCFERLSDCEPYLSRHFAWRAECQGLLDQCLPRLPGGKHDGRLCRRMLSRCEQLLDQRAASEKRCLEETGESTSKSKRSDRLRRFQLQRDLIKVRTWCASVWPNDIQQQSQCVSQQLKDLQRLRSTVR